MSVCPSPWCEIEGRNLHFSKTPGGPEAFPNPLGYDLILYNQPFGCEYIAKRCLQIFLYFLHPPKNGGKMLQPSKTIYPRTRSESDLAMKTELLMIPGGYSGYSPPGFCTCQMHMVSRRCFMFPRFLSGTNRIEFGGGVFFDEQRNLAGFYCFAVDVLSCYASQISSQLLLLYHKNSC